MGTHPENVFVCCANLGEDTPSVFTFLSCQHHGSLERVAAPLHIPKDTVFTKVTQMDSHPGVGRPPKPKHVMLFFVVWAVIRESCHSAQVFGFGSIAAIIADELAQVHQPSG